MESGSIESLYNETIFLFSSLDTFGVIDLLLVTGSFYLLLSLIRNSSLAYLLREVLILGLLLFILTTLLPLPVFDWLVRGVVVALLVMTPIIFQAPLRRFLERVGRSAGLAQSMRPNAVETLVPELIHAVEDMSASRTGALIVLEGYDSLEEIIKSGVTSGGRVTNELLQSIFYSGTPLHDGAVIVRGEQIVAAGCVLPLTQQSLNAEKRLGTRHRAAVGISETSDALIIIVSEETGHIGVAQHGQLDRPLNPLEIRDRLVDFYDPESSTAPTLSLGGLILQVFRQFWSPRSLLNPRRLLSNLGLLLISLMLALVVWSFVIEQTNPLRQERIDNIPLRVENIPPNTRLIPTPPPTISAVIQTTEGILPTLGPRSFQAVVILENPEPGLHRLPVQVNSSEVQALVLSVEPAALDFELAPIISTTLPVKVNIPNPENVPAAYELVGTPIASPDEVQAIGPAPLLETVTEVQAVISVANATTSVIETRPLRALDEMGQEVTGVTLEPAQAQVNLIVRRRLNARDVSVNVVTNGTVPDGYEIDGISVTPTTVTLQGGFDRLSEMGNFINTLPIDVSQTTSDLTVQIPLDLPVGIQALDSNGNIANSVRVSIQIEPRQGSLTVNRSVELITETESSTITISPPRLTLLIEGPLPILNEIEANPDLVQVFVDVNETRRGRSIDLIPEIIAPEEVNIDIIPPSVLVTTR